MDQASKRLLARVTPFSLSIAVVIIDQISKFLVATYIPRFNGRPFFTMFGDFFWLIHVRNRGAVFSLGSDTSGVLRILMLYALPILLLIFLSFSVLQIGWPKLQRYCMAGVLGGGMGNMIDRFFRPEGVVDFASVNFYGLFNLERWPTFNVADSSVVISMLVWFISMLFIKGVPASESS